MDALSEVLKAVRLEGAIFFNGEFSAPWCFAACASDIAAHYQPDGSGRHIMYHFLMEGRAWTKLPDGRRIELEAGDIVVYPHGDTHLFGNGVITGPPAKAAEALAPFLAQGLKLAQFGGGGEVTRFICGFLACDARLSEVLLSGLPNMLRVNVASDPAGQWLEKSIRFSVGDLTAGSSLVVAKLAEVLFVETLRRHINSLPPDQTGWLAGTRDPHLSQALALLHEQPAHNWTVDSLARRTGQSRTRLAERFRHFLGLSPMAYLTKWRLSLGAENLQSTNASVAEVAGRVGYASEAAFNRAFRREFDCAPAQFRRSARAKKSRARHQHA